MNVYVSDWEDYENYMVSQKLCPECYAELEEVHQADGPDDFECTGVHCTKCDYEFGY